MYLAATGPLVFGKRIGGAIAAAEAAGVITSEIRARLHDPVLVVLGAIRLTLFALLVFLMTVKPDALLTLLGVIAAIALGGALGMTRRANSVTA